MSRIDGCTLFFIVSVLVAVIVILKCYDEDVWALLLTIAGSVVIIVTRLTAALVLDTTFVCNTMVGLSFLLLAISLVAVVREVLFDF